MGRPGPKPSGPLNGRKGDCDGAPKAVDEVVDLVSALIRFDTSNTGDPNHQGRGRCARWVAEQLEEVGYQTEYVESGAPGRGNVFARLAGADSSPRRAADPRPSRRGARRAGGLERASVLRRDRGRLCLGPRRGRHEGHGRHDDRGRPAFQAGRHRAAARPGVRVRRRRGARRQLRLRSGWSTTGPTCSRASPRRSARSAASR